MENYKKERFEENIIDLDEYKDLKRVYYCGNTTQSFIKNKKIYKCDKDIYSLKDFKGNDLVEFFKNQIELIKNGKQKFCEYLDNFYICESSYKVKEGHCYDYSGYRFYFTLFELWVVNIHSVVDELLYNQKWLGTDDDINCVISEYMRCVKVIEEEEDGYEDEDEYEDE